MIVRRKHIRALAEQLLQDNKIDRPPVPVDQLARSLRLQIVHEDADEALSGFLLRESGNVAAIVGVNGSHHEHRQRFTIAHEIGHFLLHAGERLHVDHTDRMFRISKRDEESSRGTSIEEREANLFAAELLMPAKQLLRDWREKGDLQLFGDEDRLKRLVTAYKVSSQALAFRLAYLGMAPDQ
jgi:Zn-dependent peptidase ImmA (M78 family)